MTDGQQINQFRALDFDEEDILFSPLVRYHFEREAMEDLQKLNAGEFEAAPEEAALAKKRAKKYYRRSQRIRLLRHSYHVLQKVSVFLVVLAAGFTFLTVRVDAVNKAVVNWLTEIYQTHTHLSIGMENSNIDLSDIKINWLPENVMVQKLDTAAIASFSINYGDQSVGSILCQNHDSNMSLNTENAVTTYLSLPGFDRVMLIEHPNAISILATNSDIIITIITFTQTGYPFTTGEVLNILQNIEY